MRGTEFVLQAASALENADDEQRALRKYLRSTIIKIPEISVGSQMERFVSVRSNRNIRDHLLIGRTGRTENYRSNLTNRLISRFSSVDFQLYQGLGKVKSFSFQLARCDQKILFHYSSGIPACL